MNLITYIHIAIADKKKRKKLSKLFSKMKKAGRNIEIGKNCSISSLSKFEIGDNVWIGDNFYAKAEGEIKIGSGTIISRNVEIWTSNHNYDSDDLMTIPYDKRFINKPVVIGENCWIGTHVIFLPGVTIGEGVVVGAGSVVTKDIPDYAVIGGNPAKVIKYRNIDTYKKLKKENKIYLDVEYDYDKSSLRKSEYRSWQKAD